VEFVVLSAVLVPLLLIVPLVGKHMDLAQTTAMASRYVAFEGTVRHSSSTGGWKTDAELAQEVRRRFFSNSDAPVKTGDAAGDFNAHRNTLWFDHRSDPMLPEFASNVGVETRRESLSQPFGTVFAGSLGLPTENLHTGTVTVQVADVADLPPFDSLGLSMARSTALLADPWAASGPGQVKDKVAGAPNNLVGHFPYGGLELVALPLNPFISLLEFDSAPPDIGRVTPDRVPADRLGSAP
jgi:hypothetical protein